MTSEDLNKRIKAHAERSDVVSKLTALLIAWEEGIASARWADVRIREAGDAYMEALAEFIDSRAKLAVLSLREPSKVVAPPFAIDPQHSADYVAPDDEDDGSHYFKVLDRHDPAS